MEDPPIPPTNESIGAGPFDRERLQEHADLPLRGREGIEGSSETLLEPDGYRFEESAELEDLDQLGGTRGVEVTLLLQTGHRDLADRSGPVHQREHVRFPRFEAVVEHRARVRHHHVVVTPPQGEALDLDVVGELRPESAEIDAIQDGLVDVRAATCVGERRLEHHSQIDRFLRLIQVPLKREVHVHTRPRDASPAHGRVEFDRQHDAGHDDGEDDRSHAPPSGDRRTRAGHHAVCGPLRSRVVLVRDAIGHEMTHWYTREPLS